MQIRKQNIRSLLDRGSLKRILVIRFSSLGDVLLTTPLIRSLKKQYPGILIDYLVKPAYKDLLANNPYINRLLIFNKEKASELVPELKKNKYDLIIDLQNNIRSARLSSSLNVFRTTFNKRSFKKFLLVKLKINKLKNEPPLPERYAEAVYGLELDGGGLDLFTRKSANVLLSEDKIWVGLAPGSRHFTKMWPEEYYIELGRLLVSGGFGVVLLGGSSDKEICGRISQSIPDSLNLCRGEDDILQIAADMQKCRLIFCNDSGLMHTASAVKIPVIAFFGSTVREFGFSPFNNKYLILENELLSCRPCTHIGRSECPLGHFKCMLEINPGLAYKNFIEFVKEA